MSSPNKYSPFRQLERQYDPILQVFRDPEIEQKTRVLEKQRLAQAVVRSRDRLISNSKFFELLSSPSAVTSLPPARHYGLQSTYNLLSTDPPHPRSQEQSPVVKVQRPFDIISGQYYRNHEDKVKAEFMKSKLEAVHKYWQTRDFQPVLGKFVDEDKEKRIREMEAIRQNLQIERKQRSLPLSYQIHDMYYKNPAVNLDTAPVPLEHRKRYEVRHFHEIQERAKNEVAERKQLQGGRFLAAHKIAGDSREDRSPFKTDYRSPNTSQQYGKVWERLQNDSLANSVYH